jgi:hypothetical protein
LSLAQGAATRPFTRPPGKTASSPGKKQVDKEPFFQAFVFLLMLRFILIALVVIYFAGRAFRTNDQIDVL